MDSALACRSCGDGDLVDMGACPAPPAGQANGDPGRLYRCRVCTLGQRHPIPDADAIAAMYIDASPDEMDYAYDENPAWSTSRELLLARFGERADVKVLDIGCHTGAFLAGLPGSWARHGVESAREPSRVAREDHAINVVAGRIEDVSDTWVGTFDAVSMFDVLEHLPDPGAGIAWASRLLKPGGVLLVSSADLDAWTFRWLGSGHWYLQTPQHLCVVSRSYLKGMADSHGLDVQGAHSIPHRRATLPTRIGESLQALYWGMRRRRGAWRIPHRILQTLPGLRSLRHMQSVPWTMTLNDHLLGLYERRV